MPSADLNCDDLTTTCHLALGFVVVFGGGFFKGMFLNIFLETTSLESVLFKNKSLTAC